MEVQVNRAGRIPAVALRAVLVAVGLIGAALLFISTRQDHSPPASPPLTVPVLPPEPGSLAYLEFGPNADTIWYARPDHPETRRKGFSAPHANGFGLVGALSPDSQTIAFTRLEPDTANPAPDTPANLYASPLTGSPRLVTKGVDLLVRPVWTQDGKAVVVRHTDSGADGVAYRLSAIIVANGQERPLVSSTSALFPVGFNQDGSFYFVELAPGSSDLRVLDKGEIRQVAHLADDLTRDWAISPTGDRLAYLALSLMTDRIASRVMVLDIASGTIQAALGGDYGGDADQFAPAWSTSGELAFGALIADQDATPATTVGGEVSLTPPTTGFDVPVGWSPDGKLLAVRNFSGHSANDPGQATLSVAGADGFRNVISGAEVTFLGWLTP